MKSLEQWGLQEGWRRNEAKPVAPTLTSPKAWLSQQLGPRRLEDRTARRSQGLLWHRWETGGGGRQEPPEEPSQSLLLAGFGKGQQQAGWGMGEPVLLPLYTTQSSMVSLEPSFLVPTPPYM